MSTKKPAAASANNLTTLRAKHDPVVVTVAKCEAQLSKLRAQGPEAWQYEKDFLQGAGIGMTHVRHVREKYAKYTAVVREIGGKSEGKTVWFHNPKLAATIRKEQEKLAQDEG